MSSVVYKPAEVLQWFGEDSRQSKGRARRQGMDLVRKAGQENIVKSFQSAVGAATSFGRGAVADIVQAKLEVTEYRFHETGLEITTLTKVRKVAYDQIRQIIAKHGDKYQVLFNGGTFMVKPIAHLVSGRLRVPVGWMRAGMEVPYTMLLEELSARSGVEIDPE